jgi:CubicO group peptidase (beta-lactamase class C family)
MTSFFLITATLSIALLSSDSPTLCGNGQDTIDAFLHQSVESRKVPGLVALVISDDKVPYSGAFGKQNVAEDIDMREDSIFRIASMTKPITSVAVMQLVEQGKIGLDDPVSKYLPDLAKPQVFERIDESTGKLVTRPAEEITIRQLLSHTSGFGYEYFHPTLQRMVHETKKQPRDLPLVHDPGKQWIYGMSTFVLGELVEQVSGRKLDQYLEAHIFKPLDMVDTGFTLPKEQLFRLVSMHRREDGKLGEDANPTEASVTVRGDYGLYSKRDGKPETR